MSLTSRVSIFFLATQAIVLLGFSAAVYAVARVYLLRQVEERVASALDTLDSAVDRDPQGLEWELHERHVAIGHEPGPEAVRWEVLDESGKSLDRSPNLGKSHLGMVPDGQERGHEVIEQDGQAWHTAWREARAPSPKLPPSPTEPPRHSMLLLRVSASLEPVGATLRRLAAVLIGVSGSVWLASALAGRWLCRRAIAPIGRMAAAAQDMDASDLQHRLPDPKTADELAELHRAFNGLLDRLQEAFERQRRFTGDASHQLRTPLTAMLGQVEVALRRERTGEDYRKVLTLVGNQADHLRQIVEALLFLARADADADLSRLEEIDLAIWLPKYVEQWKSHARANDLHLDCPGKAMVRAQPLLLGQMLDNLLDNAFKYSNLGTPVTIAARREARTVALVVEDIGQGIGLEDLSHVFDAFHRSAESRRKGQVGVGLGLAMARRIAIAFGGTLVAESEIGRGSQFTLRLPPL